MSAKLLKGGPVAAALDEESAKRVERLRAAGCEPCLAIVRVGEREDDVAYERGARKRCEKLGIRVKSAALPENAGQQVLIDELTRLGADNSVHGILLLRPLPRGYDEAAACRAIPPQKDVDGVTEGSLSTVFCGFGEGFAPCTARSCMEILKFYGVELEGRRAAVLGRSLVVGRPLAMMLMQENATVCICHTRTRDAAAICRKADIVVAAVGHAESIGADYFAPQQIVLDVGTNWSEEKGGLCGDLDFSAAEPVVSALSPVPGGVGSVTTAVLATHVTEAAEAALRGGRNA